MTDLSPADTLKHAAAEAALAEVTPGMIIGLGTGTTAHFVITGLAARVRDGMRVRAVATSIASERHAAALGIELLDMADLAQIDPAIDGVDEIDPQLRAIKGRGGAMLREKIVAAAAQRMIAVCDGSKRGPALGAKPVPVEVLPFARTAVAAALAALDAVATLRLENGAIYRTDQANCIFDCGFERLDDPARLAALLAAIPGVLGHGLFLSEIDAVYVADADGVTLTERPR